MRRKLALTLTVSLALLLPLVHSGVAGAAPDHAITLTADSGPQSWDGAAATGLNQDYNSAAGTPCPDTPSGPEDYCEQALLHVDVATPVDIEVTLADNPAADFDLYVYDSDAAGSRGALRDSSANPQTLFEAVQIPDATGFFLVQVVYFQSVETGYAATATITGEGGGGGGGGTPLPETEFFFHDDGDADPTFGAFDTTAPSGAEPTVAPGVLGTVDPVPATWTGSIDAGGIDTLKVDFWQHAPVGQVLLGDVVYRVTLTVGGRSFQFPEFRQLAPLGPNPDRVTHVFSADEPGSPLPVASPGGDASVEIVGFFVDTQAVTAIYYDSTETPSGFSVNPPVPPTRARFAPDVDEPAGLQEFLASDPSQGWTSRSEPHVAQSPVDPNVLVAGSKFYNRDPDALNEYEFKIGTYASVDGGRTWTDLGQLAVCPLADAPPESWPEANTCYPADDPSQEGPEAGGPDIGEEYITSDVWVNFDDEGNAYAMVLDHPPFDGAGEGNGWGMSFHRWESVSAEDLQPGGTTWGPRTPINFYADDTTQLFLLDDKNTFAVNNAGPDGDGQVGTMIACWGQSVSPPVGGKQQIVCERSTDGGATWPDDPLPISDVQALVIGVHVVADTQDPQTFYATWMQYATGGSAGNIGGALTPETLEFAVTRDGGQTWVHRPAPVAAITQIPRQFPGQSFRNLTIPIMAAGPSGELYITWAEYVEASDPTNDEDGREADIVMVKSTDGGITWSGPTPVTNDEAAPNPNADQFQPYVTVTESGQVVLAYFDRRLDARTPSHPGNYFTDVFLARSNDGGATFTEHRLTHDATDPEHNAAVSPSGLFFGDYQGLVADDCTAIPFFNDTHRANDELDPGPTRDPDFDSGVATSPYQEAVAWRVPNTPAFGGPPAAECLPDLTVSPDDIAFEKVGGQVRVTVTVHNVGDVDAAGVGVLFEQDDKPVGTATIASIPAGGTGTATIMWKPKGKQPVITVTVDSTDTIEELDETNNSAGRARP